MILNHQLGLKKTECIFELMILNNNQVIKNNLLIVFFLISLVIISSQTSAQNCSEASDSLEINIEFIGYNSCNLLISAESSVFNYSSDDYDIDIEYLWSVDEYLLPNGISTEIPNLIALSGDSLTSTFEITLTNLDSLSLGIEYAITCSYSEVISMQEIEETYDLWSCDCQLGGQPEASFEVQNAGTCGNTGITFSNTAIGGQGPTYDWSFGNNYEYGQSFEASPIVEILIDGGGSSSIPVTLLIVDINGCTDQVTEMVDILQTPNPGNSFDIDNLCTGNPNEVSQSVSFLPLPYANGGIEEIIIDWDIGVVSYQQPFDPFFNIESPLYTGFGYYNIGIDLIGYNGCVTTIIESLFIGNNPQIGTANPGNTDGLCSPFLLDFPISNFSTNDNSTTYEVDFGDGTEPSTFSHPPPALVSHNYFTSSCGSSTPEGNINAFRFKVEATNDCGTSTTTVDPIRIHSAPAPVISGEDTVCVNVPWTYQSPNTGVWVDDNSFECQEQDGFWDIIPLEGQTPPTPNFGLGVSLQTIFNEPGLYDIHILEMHESCDDGEDYFQVCVYPELFPLAEFTPNNGCIPLEVELNDISPPIACGSIIRQWQIIGGEYEWAQESSPNSINPTVILLEGVDYQINLVHTPDFTFNNPNTPASTYCNTGIYSMTVEAYDIPEVEIEVLNEHLCEGESTTSNVIFFDNGNLDEFDFQWIVDGVVISEENAPITLPLFSSGIHTVQSITSNICGTDIDLIDITVETNPVITVDGPLGDCIGNTISFEASGAENYLWTGNNDDVNANPAEYVVSNTTTETVTGSIDYGSITCYSYESFEIEAYTIPQIEINGDLELCDQDIISLTTLISSGTPDYEVTWSEANESLTNLEFISTAILSTSPITATVFDINGCSSNNQVVFTINPLPSVTAGVDIELCNQEISTILSESDPSGGTWQGLGITNSSTGEFDPSIIGEGATELIYEYTDGYGCTNSDSLIIDVVAPIFANAGPDLAICNIDTIVTLEGFFPDDGVWTDPNVSPTNDIDITGFSPGVYSYTYSFGEETCYTQDMMLLEVHGRPNLDWSGPQSLCINETGVFELSIEGGTGPYIIEWLTEMDEIQDDGYLAINTWDASGPQQQEVFVTDFYGCSNYVSFEVIINPPPLVNAGPDTSFCNQPIPGNILGFSPGLTEGGVGYFYGLDDAALPGAVSTNGAVDPSVTGIGTFEVVYSFTSEATGCTNLDTLTILISDPLVADAGMDTVICFNAPLVQLEGYYPDIGILWSGTEQISDGAVINAQTGIINPQLLNPGAYTFLLEYGVGTCYSTDIVNVTIDPLPAIDISSDEAFCGNLGEVSLISPIPNGGYWFGDNVVDPIEGIINTNVTQGNYEYFYTYTDPVTTCSDTIVHQVDIFPVPVSLFSTDELGCNNTNYPFEQLSTGAIEFEWDLGNGEVSDASTPDYIYPDIGTYEVTLFASNFWGCMDTSNVNIEVTELPVPYFIMSTEFGCAPLEVSFVNESYSPYGEFEWTMNGEIFTNETPPNQFFIQGDSILMHEVQLTVSNLCGSDTFLDSITVLPIPQMSFYLLNDTACSPFSAELLYSGLGLPNEINWDYGNGQTSTGSTPISPIYIVDSLLTVFDITVTGENECGTDIFTLPIWIQPNTLDAFFTSNVTSGCPPLELVVENVSITPVNMTFDFGDGNFSSEDSATNIYYEEGEYTITQYITNGCSYDTIAIDISVHPEPQFSLISEASEFCEGEEANFSVDVVSPGSISWEFGDEGLDVGMSVNYTFDNSGTYEVVATVESNFYGCVGTETIGIEVFPTPVLEISSLLDYGCSPLEVEFENLSTDTDFWIWDFDDSSINGVVSSPTHTFVNTTYDQQNFNVGVNAATINGCESDTTFTISVLPAPIADFVITEDLFCGIPSFINMTNISDGAQAYSWSFNDQETSGMFETIYEANQFGPLVVELVATNGFGCTDEEAQTINIYEYPVPQILFTPNSGCEPLEITFNDVSEGAISSHITIANSDWLIHNGPIPNVPLTINNSGNYIIHMTAVSSEGCIANLEAPEMIYVWPKPIADFDAQPVVGSTNDPSASHLSNTEFEFINTSIGYETSYWVLSNGAISNENNPTFDFLEAGNYFVTLVATSDMGCVNSHQETVIIPSVLDIYVPNAFTPSYDGASTPGINDAFRCEFSNLDAVDSFQLQIYNRWGILVWETNDPEEYWQGETGFDGLHYSQNDMYIWHMKIQSNTWVNNGKELKGYVTIIR